MTALPKSWVSMPLGDVGRWFGGGTPSKANPRFWAGGNIPWVSPKDMKCPLISDTEDHITKEAVAQSATNLVEAGSVLIVVRSGILQHTLPVAIAERQVTLNQDLKAVMPRNCVRSDYLALALKAFEREILHTCTKTGTTVQSLELPVFLRFEIPVAPVNDQKEIVAEVEKQFTRLEAGVAALRRVQANLKRYRAAVLKAACDGRLVRTEAELARIEGRSYEPADKLLARILTERRQKWSGRGKYKEPVSPDPAQLHSLPEGWTWITIDQMLAQPLCNGISIKGSDNPPGVRALRLSAMSEYGFDYANSRYLPLADSDVDDLWIQEGDFFMSRGNGSLHLVGRGTVAQKAPVPTIFPDTMIRLRFAREIKKSGWIPTLWPSRMIRSQIEREVKTTAGIFKIAQPQVERMTIPLPPHSEQKRIVAEVQRRLSVIDQLEAVVTTNLQRAKRLRQSVLQKAFTCELVGMGSATS
jgi:type I restriction enzyme, S subunit